MAESKYAAVEALREYFRRKNEMEYSAIMNKAKKDKKFEEMIVCMTTARLVNGSSLAKNKFTF